MPTPTADELLTRNLLEIAEVLNKMRDLREHPPLGVNVTAQMQALQLNLTTLRESQTALSETVKADLETRKLNAEKLAPSSVLADTGRKLGKTPAQLVDMMREHPDQPLYYIPDDAHGDIAQAVMLDGIQRGIVIPKITQQSQAVEAAANAAIRQQQEGSAPFERMTKTIEGINAGIGFAAMAIFVPAAIGATAWVIGKHTEWGREHLGGAVAFGEDMFAKITSPAFVQQAGQIAWDGAVIAANDVTGRPIMGDPAQARGRINPNLRNMTAGIAATGSCSLARSGVIPSGPSGPPVGCN